MNTFRDIFKKSFLEGFANTDISTTKIMAAMLVTCVLALYIFAIYRIVTRKTFYSKSFNISLAAIAVITSSIILAMQSNLVISLGMVGALSIVRFRTAIKDPMDLVFLFWSISIGIICGAGMYEIAVVTCVIITIGLLGLDKLPAAKPSMLLMVSLSDPDVEEDIKGTVKKFSKVCTVKSRNLTREQLDLIIEVRTKEETGLINEIGNMKETQAVSLMSHDGDVTF